jgi:hypothetical protein
LAAVGDLGTELEMNRSWEMIRIARIVKFQPKERLGYYELKKHKPWFGDECSEL